MPLNDLIRQKKISPTDWKVLEESLVLSPSSYGLQPWKFLVVQNPQIRKELRAASWNQSQVDDCSHFIVITFKEKVDENYVAKYIKQIAKVRNLDEASLDGFRKAILGDVVHGPRSKVIQEWAQRQTYIAMGFVMEAASLLKIDTCPMEGLDPAAYDKILKLEGKGWKTVAAVAVGYRHSEDSLASAKKVRFDHNEIVEWVN